MSAIDWIVLFGTLFIIVLYGTWKTRGSKNMESYLKGDHKSRWWMIGLSIMATQASAITFLSTPGQAIEDGMRFLQFYFGMPLAIVIISYTMVPIYYKLKVYTAYEYLETRFDLKTRILGAVLFFIQRGLAAGITLFAPALVLSTILGWNVMVTTIIIGVLVVIYVVSGGTKAVSITQQQQMAVIFVGMLMAGYMAYHLVSDKLSFGDTIQVAGHLGKFNLVNTQFDPDDRYNIWSGLFASTFLFLSYFGTDQSQVSRYLGGKSISESRIGLMFNGLLKVPMQFLILFIGVMVFVFYLFYQPPVFYNQQLKDQTLTTPYASVLNELDNEYNNLYAQKRLAVDQLVMGIQEDKSTDIETAKATLSEIQKKDNTLRDSVRQVISAAIPGAKTQDRDYIFLNFIINHLPHGIIGLLLAVMFSAAMSSSSSELNALAATTTVDIYKRTIKPEAEPAHYLKMSRWFTVLWAVLAITFAIFASFAENLIQFVNIVGSLFYGTILGIFLTAFYIKYVKGTAIFIAALIGEAVILYCYFFTDIAYLFFNLMGCVVVIVLGILIQMIEPKQ